MQSTATALTQHTVTSQRLSTKNMPACLILFPTDLLHVSEAKHPIPPTDCMTLLALNIHRTLHNLVDSHSSHHTERRTPF